LNDNKKIKEERKVWEGKKHHVANTKQRGAAILVARSHVLACNGW